MPALAIPTQGFRPFEPPVAPKDRPDTYPKGRRCALGACGTPDAPTILSIYNGGETCSVCTVKLKRIADRAARQ